MELLSIVFHLAGLSVCNMSPLTSYTVSFKTAGQQHEPRWNLRCLQPGAPLQPASPRVMMLPFDLTPSAVDRALRGEIHEQSPIQSP